MLRERIRDREDARFGPQNRTASGEWSGWMEARVELLESTGGFPLAARQAAAREMRERR